MVGEHPCEGVRTRSNARVRLAHYSWTEVLGKAVQAKVHHGVSDLEHSWILGELIRYLKHPASGAMAFADMGSHWTTVREGARLVVESWPRLARQPICATVGRAREDRDVLLDPDRRKILRFRLVGRCERPIIDRGDMGEAVDAARVES